uniref:NADH dehydrogenase subunit 7 n=1 Tax=Corydalis trisecta TaxID=2682942 RepID=A0A8K1SP75_9MAGN|nr:NADH dehydrogenase subunit 7 [Corydalis trisecta]UFP91487.1 NADH dehydrogenase subunit 7 [Corydalis trisecta]
MIQSERKQRQRHNYKWLRPEEPDACYYRPFKKTTSVSLENGSAGGSLRPFRGSVRGYGADRDGTTHGTDFWDFFDTEIDEDHSRISHISEFEISIHTMDLKKLHRERQRYLSLIHDGEQIFNSTEKRSLLLEKGAVIRHENGGRKKLMKIPFSNEEEIQVHPKSESWEWEILTVQKPILASSALFQAKAKQIEKEISIKEQLPRLEHAEKDGPRIRDREKKTGAALLRYKKDPRKRELSSSYQKLKEPVGGQKPYPWRQLEDVLESIKMIQQALEGLPGGAYENLEVRRFGRERDSEWNDFEYRFISKKPSPAFELLKQELSMRVEAPKGELVIFLIGDQSLFPWRWKIRPPGFLNLQILPQLVKRMKLADIMTILGSMDIIMGEVDR